MILGFKNINKYKYSQLPSNSHLFHWTWQYVPCGVSSSISFWSSKQVLTNSSLVTFPSPSPSIFLKIVLALSAGCSRDTSCAFLSFISWWRDFTNLVISVRSIHPLPSTSYILKAQFSLSSGVPLEVT